MKRLAWLLVTASFFVSGHTIAYELGTHARITEQAYTASVLATDPTLVSDLGLSEADPIVPFGNTYYEIIGGGVETRSALSFFLESIEPDLRIWPDSQSNTPLSMQAWLMRGAIREDDYKNQSFLFGLCKIEDEPPIPAEENPLSRPVNHFYDPVNNIGITGQKRATDWGLGADNALQVPNQPDIGRANHYTIVDAREAMYRALTGQSSTGSSTIGPGGTLADESVRNAYWATTFRILGDIVHLVQDMGQPQHTRNDPHAGVCGVTGAKSVYEEYIDARAKGSEFTTPGGTPILPTPLNYTGYPVPQLNDFVSYFTTRHLDGSNLLARRGLADYSNRGFFSAGKNLFAPANDYSLPEQNPPAYGRIDVSVDWSGNPLPNNAKVELLTHTVPDALTGKTPSAALTTFGLWDQFLEERSFPSRYALTRPNYDDMANLLVPRAVAYSAGLINYFFRGRIDMVPDYSGSGAYVIQNLSNEDMVGTFELFYDDVNGIRRPVQNASWNITVPAGSQGPSLSFTRPTDPLPGDPNRYILVFRGNIGSEQAFAGNVGAVAAKVVSLVTLYSAQYDDDWNLVNWYRSRDLGVSWKPVGVSADETEYIETAYYLGNGELLSLSDTSVSKSSDAASTWSQKLAFDFDPRNFVINWENSILMDAADCSTSATPLLRASFDNGETWDNCDIAAEKTSLQFLTRLRDGTIVGMVQNYKPYIFAEITPLGRTVGDGGCAAGAGFDCDPTMEEWSISVYRKVLQNGVSVRDDLFGGHYSEEFRYVACPNWFGRHTFTDSPVDARFLGDHISLLSHKRGMKKA